jgi:hypothetical protein
LYPGKLLPTGGFTGSQDVRVQNYCLWLAKAPRYEPIIFRFTKLISRCKNGFLIRIVVTKVMWSAFIFDHVFSSRVAKMFETIKGEDGHNSACHQQLRSDVFCCDYWHFCDTVVLEGKDAAWDCQQSASIQSRSSTLESCSCLLVVQYDINSLWSQKKGIDFPVISVIVYSKVPRPFSVQTAKSASGKSRKAGWFQ